MGFYAGLSGRAMSRKEIAVVNREALAVGRE
jgi:hypothetical protein